MRTTRLRITMREIEPAVVRVVDVPASTTLPELHDLLQVALGWTDSHLHEFVAGEVAYGVPDMDMDWQQDETTVGLKDLPPTFMYRYDFGDGWEHDVEVLGRGDAEPGCRYGEGACPPEDCGGPFGYAELLAVLDDPAHPEHAHMREWAGELAPFDQVATDLLVRQTVGTVPAGVRLVLDLAADGVKLTPGGRLPRAFVRQVQAQRPAWGWDERPVSIEEDLLPLAALHEILRKVGLLRLAKGVVRPTRVAADDLEVVRRLRSWFEPGSYTALLAGVTVAVLATNDPMDDATLARRVYPWFDHGWSTEGRPLTEDDVRRSIGMLGNELRALDLVEHDWKTWSAGPSARTLLPHATALAHLWGRG
ncbi:MAG: plasmid pRiA4b ORF-3 family protein [Pseudonocardia sp.]